MHSMEPIFNKMKYFYVLALPMWKRKLSDGMSSNVISNNNPYYLYTPFDYPCLLSKYEYCKES